MNKVVFLVLFLFCLFSGLLFYQFFVHHEFATLKINNTVIKVEIADTVVKKIKGLSGRQRLPENQGMLFVFDTLDYYSFWMKEMKFPLDFIWIADNKVVEITPSVAQEDYQPPKTLTPHIRVNKVLEVNAGFAVSHGVKVGDIVLTGGAGGW
jgi:uncharacterized membrane protein (UPF0127 family)